MVYKQRKIVLLPFPYSDLSAIKKRLVLKIGNNKFNEINEDVIVVTITSKIFKDDDSIQI